MSSDVERAAFGDAYGYVEAFYRIADALGLGVARAMSPKQFFEEEMLPAITALRSDTGQDALVEDSFLSGFCAARGVRHVTELSENLYHAAHMAFQDFAALAQGQSR